MKGYDASRVELFAHGGRPGAEAPAARALRLRRMEGLPSGAPDYHVEIDGSWYSVPYRLIREQVDVRISERTVEIFHKGQRVASQRPIARTVAGTRRSPSTCPARTAGMPSGRRRGWMASAEKIGPAAAALISTIMTASDPIPSRASAAAWAS